METEFNSLQAKKWVNKTIKFEDPKERLKTTMRTTEPAEEFLENYEKRMPYTSALYTTHSSTEEAPRVRILVPMTRNVTPEEFVTISRYLAQAGMEFDAVSDGEAWCTKLKYQPRTGLLENSVFNLNLILNHDTAFTKVAHDRHFYPVRNYLNSLPEWNGKKRVETVFIKYLLADDTEYVCTVTRKTFAAAVARIYVPGIKFDCVPVLDGDQGIGKSSIVKDLVAPDYYSETLFLTDMDDKSGAEKLQGFWVVEIGELAGMKMADIEKVKRTG